MSLARGRSRWPALARVVFVGAGFSIPLAASGALHWATRELYVQVKPGESRAVAIFRFNNAGTEEVRLRAITPSCDCVKVADFSRSLAAGENAEISAEIEVPKVGGTFEYRLQVESSLNEIEQLKLVVEAPQDGALRPRLMRWEKGGAAAELQAELQLFGPGGSAVIGVDSLHPNFTARFAARSGQPGQFVIFVQPRETGQPMQEAIRIRTEGGGGAQVHVLYAVIR